MAKVIVVGGGYAGVSAATALAEQGFTVDLVETRSSLGGRVYSIPPGESFPAPCDNGPHLFLGCYRDTWTLFKRLEVENTFHWINPLEITWVSPGGVLARFTCARLPAPFHLAVGLIRSKAFPLKEKFSLALALQRFARKPFSIPNNVLTVEDLLNHTRQGPLSRERFWEPLCRAVMNLQPEQSSLPEFGEALHRAFFGTRADSAVAISAKPLSELAFPKVEGFLRQRGGTVHLGDPARHLRLASGPFEVETASRKIFTGEALVLALPPRSLEALWSTSDLPSPVSAEKMGRSPILSVNLLLDRPIMEAHWMGLPGAHFEWVFNRNGNWGSPGPGQYLSLVSSADHELARKNDKEILVLALEELQRHIPQARAAQRLHSKVIKEMTATFALTPTASPSRPPCETVFENVFLAGDFTATGLPATIEGACYSGHRAAMKIKEFLVSKSGSKAE
jgi:squalene-associated FAD-dependent desaturase